METTICVGIKGESDIYTKGKEITINKSFSDITFEDIRQKIPKGSIQGWFFIKEKKTALTK